MKRQTKFLVVCNVVTFAILSALIIKDDYPQRIFTRLDNFVHNRPNIKPHHFTDNPEYEQQTGFYPYYHSMKKIAMLGNSLTGRINWGELLNRTDVANFGVDGDITEGYVNRLYYIIKIKPAICFIEGGTNDLFYQIPIDTTLQNLKKIVQQLKSNGILPVLTTIPYVAKNFPEALEMNKRISELNAEVEELAGQEKIKLLNLNNLLSDNGHIAGEYVISDGLHLTGKAYEVWSREVNRVLQEEGL